LTNPRQSLDNIVPGRRAFLPGFLFKPSSKIRGICALGAALLLLLVAACQNKGGAGDTENHSTPDRSGALSTEPGAEVSKDPSKAESENAPAGSNPKAETAKEEKAPTPNLAEKIIIFD